MTHWGWYWKVKKKHVSRTLCSKLFSIDSFDIYKKNQLSGFIMQPLEVNAKKTEEGLEITYRKRKLPSYTIGIDKVPCNYGGFRYFFKCPLCVQRMRILYFAQNSVFLCRRCLNLSYDTQRMRPTKRYEHINNKVKALIKEKGGNLDTYKKPPRMHTNTYKRLKSKQFYYESKSYQALNRELREWYSPKTTAMLDEFFDYVDESKDWKNKRTA